MDILIGETLSMAVIDSGCTRTVCGQVWLDCYLQSSSNKTSNQFERKRVKFYLDLEMVNFSNLLLSTEVI